MTGNAHLRFRYCNVLACSVAFAASVSVCLPTNNEQKTIANREQLQNELHTHLAATARRNGLPCDHPPSADSSVIIPCWSKERLPERREEQDEEWEDYSGPIRGRVPGMSDLGPEPPDDATWYPDEPEWILRDLSWAQRHLVDVYAVYGALVMGVGLLMKLTWNLVW